MAGRPRKIKPADETNVLYAGADAPETAEQISHLPAYHKEHPDKLSGQALRDLAHRHGLAKSELATMPDEKIRVQLRYIAYSRAE